MTRSESALLPVQRVALPHDLRLGRDLCGERVAAGHVAVSPLLQESEDLIASIIARRLGRVGDVEALPVPLHGLRER